MREADRYDLDPVDRSEFAAAIAPALQLVAPVGMDLESQDTWMEAAFKALDGIPIALLKRGAIEAMKVADHPAKIVPAIIAATAASWQWRKDNRPLPASDRENHADKMLERLQSREMTQAEIDALPDHLKRVAWNRGILTTDYEGRFWLPGARPVAA